MKATPGTKYISGPFMIWSSDGREIHLTSNEPGPDGKPWFHTTFTDEPSSKRYHPNAFAKFKVLLVLAGRWPDV
jgi:hypothetical protein